MNKKNLILSGVLMLLIIFAWAYQGPLKDYKARVGKAGNFLSALNMDQVDRMEIARNGKTDVFLKNGDKWKIDGTKDFWMDSSLAKGITDSLASAKTADASVVSENPKKKIDYRTDEQGIAVKLFSGQSTVSDFIVGNNTADYQGTYVSQTGSDKTYSIKAGLNLAFYNDNWYDQTIFEGDKTKIAKVRFQYPKIGFTVEKVLPKGDASSTAGAPDVWKGTKPYAFSVSAEKIDKILDIMSNLTAAEIPAQTFAGTGLEKNLIIVEATGEGVANTLMIGDAKKTDSATDEKMYYAKRGDSDNIYLITETEKDELVKKMQDLK
jgi:hypothetical protein